jgi:hypothetical protein
MKKIHPHADYWELKLHKPQLRNIKLISLTPCKIVKDNEEFLMVKCTNDEATFWSVAITDTNNEAFTVADCKTNDIAIEFLNWFIYIQSLIQRK